MKANNKHLFVGAILTLIASYFAVVAHNDTVGGVFFAISNFLLYYFAVCVIWEYCHDMLNPKESNE